MAEDNKPSDIEKPAPETEVNIRKSVLIIKPKLNSLKGVEVFLTKRDWELYSATDLKTAFQLITEKSPQFVMISAEHPDPRILKLPKLLAQAFPCIVIMYADEGTNQALKILRESGLEYTIAPPVTGPAIERIVLKIQKNLQKKDSEIRIATGDGSSPNSSNMIINIKGSLTPNQKQTMEAAKGLLYQLAQEGNEGKEFSTTKADNQDNAFSVGQGSIKENQAAARKDSAGTAFQSQVSKTSSTLKQATKSSPHFQHDSVFVRGTKNSFEKVTVAKDITFESESVGTCRQISCISISTSQFNGYLIAAFGKDRKMDDEFLNGIRSHLTTYMKEHDQTFTAEDTLHINIQEVPFEPWALTQAAFLQSHIHDGHEVAVAFFPDKTEAIPFEASHHPDMCVIDPGHLVEEALLDFDVFIYLPTNDRFVKYAKKGSIFAKGQKQKLEMGGIKKVHIKKDDVHTLTKYQIRNHLNAKIQDFKTKNDQVA